MGERLLERVVDAKVTIGISAASPQRPIRPPILKKRYFSAATHPTRDPTEPTLNVVFSWPVAGIWIGWAEIHLLQQVVDSIF
jgi:hypothetical protein